MADFGGHKKYGTIKNPSKKILTNDEEGKRQIRRANAGLKLGPVDRDYRQKALTKGGQELKNWDVKERLRASVESTQVKRQLKSDNKRANERISSINSGKKAGLHATKRGK